MAKGSDKAAQADAAFRQLSTAYAEQELRKLKKIVKATVPILKKPGHAVARATEAVAKAAHKYSGRRVLGYTPPPRHRGRDGDLPGTHPSPDRSRRTRHGRRGDPAGARRLGLDQGSVRAADRSLRFTHVDVSLRQGDAIRCAHGMPFAMCRGLSDR